MHWFFVCEPCLKLVLVIGGSKQKTKPLGLVFIFKTFGRDSPQGNSRHLNTHIQTMPNENHGIMDFPLQNVRAGLTAEGRNSRS